MVRRAVCLPRNFAYVCHLGSYRQAYVSHRHVRHIVNKRTLNLQFQILRFDQLFQYIPYDDGLSHPPC
jgi:hypothetical protein